MGVELPLTAPPAAYTDGVARADYTWTMAVKDLALMSTLTLRGASRLTRPLEGYVHPYDAVPILARMITPGMDAEAVGTALADLLREAGA